MGRLASDKQVTAQEVTAMAAKNNKAFAAAGIKKENWKKERRRSVSESEVEQSKSGHSRPRLRCFEKGSGCVGRRRSMRRIKNGKNGEDDKNYNERRRKMKKSL